MTEKPTMTFEVLERSVRSWQRKTFPKATAATIATHLVSEAVELARSLGVDGDTLRSEVERAIAKPVRDKPEKECGDVFTLAIGVAGELGADTVAVTLPVFKTNLGRTWGEVDPTTGIVEHVEEAPSRHGDILADSFDRLMKCAVEIDDDDCGDEDDDEDPTLNERPTTFLQDVVKEVLFALGRDDEGPRETDREHSISVEGVRISFQHAPPHAVIVRVSSELNGTIALFTRQAHHEYTVGEMRACLGADAWHGVSA